MLVKYVESKRTSWEDYLDTCIYAYNTSKHESSKFTPFEVMFSRQAVLPVDFIKQKDEKCQIKEFDVDEFEQILEQNKQRFEVVKHNIKLAQERQKQQYDKKHSNPKVYKVGAIVLKKDFLKKKRAGGKFDFNWLGPYKITRSLGRGLYRIEKMDDGSVINRVHGVHLKSYKMKDSDLEVYA